MKKVINFIRNNSVKVLTVLGVLIFAIIFINKSFIIKSPRLMGDGTEYLFMQEAFRNHYSPEIQIQDVESAQEILYKTGYTKENPYLSGLNRYLNQDHKPLSQYWGVFKSTKENYYCYHFWFYSMLTAPVAELLELFNANEFRSFQIVNVLIILLFLSFVSFSSKLKLTDIQRLLFVYLFMLSGVHWYVKWPHPEVFSTTCIMASLILLYNRSYGWSIFFCALGALQNQPLLLFIPFIFIFYVVEHGFKYKKLIFFALISSISILPIIFYYYHFNTISLISATNVLNKDYVTLKRLSSLFFDVNQGMIVNIPFILLTFIIMYIHKLTKGRKSWSYYMIIPLVVLLISYPCLQQHNWNSGGQRYALWISMFLIFAVTIQIDWRKNANKTILIPFLIITQLVYIFSDVNRGNKLNDFSKWILNHYPALYNPVPEIFGERVQRKEEDVFTRCKKTFYYKNPDGQITKASVHIDSISDIFIPGVSQGIIEDQKQSLNFEEGRAYINLPPRKLNKVHTRVYLTMEDDIDTSGSNPFKGYTYKFNGQTTTNIAYEGNKSFELRPSSTSKISFKFNTIRIGDRFQVNFWCYPPNNNKVVNITTLSGNMIQQEKLKKKNENGWEYRSIDCSITKDPVKRSLFIQFNHLPDTLLYLDNVEIIRNEKL